jgi:uncharacterized protein (TIRG00374 family)
VRILKTLYVLIGVVLLVVVLSEIDLAEVWRRASQIGWGLAVVLALYLGAFVIDTFTWQMALVSIPLTASWLYRFWKVRMVGEVFNSVMPAAGMGGEPVKAVLLKRYYGIGYGPATVSLILAKTINMVALVVFLAIGFLLMLGSEALSANHKTLAGLGLAAFFVGTALFFAVQRLRASSLAGTWISRWNFARRIEAGLHHIQDMDERLVGFYTRHRGRFAVAVALAFVNWLIGIAEIYYTMIFLGHPLSLAEAWIIEAVAQLVRAGTFFIPASIGAQEGAFLLVYTAITGSPALGIVVALVRRLREVLWIGWGVALGSLFSFKAAHSTD